MAAKRLGSITLIHNSNLFADVDDRQIAAALELPSKKAAQMNFQYIRTFDSDKLPQSKFTKGFDITDFTRRCLTDETDEGALLGMSRAVSGYESAKEQFQEASRH